MPLNSFFFFDNFRVRIQHTDATSVLVGVMFMAAKTLRAILEWQDLSLLGNSSKQSVRTCNRVASPRFHPQPRLQLTFKATSCSLAVQKRFEKLKPHAGNGEGWPESLLRVKMVDRLPPELWRLIFDECERHGDFRIMKQLRLVCKAFEELSCESTSIIDAAHGSAIVSASIPSEPS